MGDDKETPSSINEEEFFYLCVGQAISMWTNTESCLIDIAARLLGSSPDKTGCVFYSIGNFHVWLNTIDDLFLLAPEYNAARKDWISLADMLRGMNDTRVRLAHHTVWHGKTKDTPRNTLLPTRYDTRSKARKYKPLTASEISDFCEDINTVMDKIAALLKLMPWHGILSPRPSDQPPEGAR